MFDDNPFITSTYEPAREKPSFNKNEHVIIKCSGCDKELVDCWIINDNPNSNSVLIVHCWKCGDKSFQKIIQGNYYLGSIGDTCMESIDHDPVTNITSIKTISQGSND